jgi:hypothetical protein
LGGLRDGFTGGQQDHRFVGSGGATPPGVAHGEFVVEQARQRAFADTNGESDLGERPGCGKVRLHECAGVDEARVGGSGEDETLALGMLDLILDDRAQAAELADIDCRHSCGKDQFSQQGSNDDDTWSLSEPIAAAIRKLEGVHDSRLVRMDGVGHAGWNPDRTEGSGDEQAVVGQNIEHSSFHEKELIALVIMLGYLLPGDVLMAGLRHW